MVVEEEGSRADTGEEDVEEEEDAEAAAGGGCEESIRRALILEEISRENWLKKVS